MGWNSANEIFDPVAQALIDVNAPDEIKTRVLGNLIGKLQGEDWDTEEESLGRFAHDPAVVEAFRRYGITLDGVVCTTCGEALRAHEIARWAGAQVVEWRMHPTFTVRWSEEDGEWVATVAEFPSLSWPGDDPVTALDGLIPTIKDALGDDDD